MPTTQWLLEEDASGCLGVSQKTLQHLREIGCLKPGTHWRSSPGSQPVPWTPEVIYHLRWCKEKMEYWTNHGANILGNAA